MMLRFFVLGIATLSITVQSARAAEFRVPTFGDALRSAGDLTIPAAWSGIWAKEDSLHLCSDPTVFVTRAGFDTLCTGATFDEEAGGIMLNCTGMVDDDSADITCTGTDNSDPDCTVLFDVHIVAMRNGDSFFRVSTANITHEPPSCDFDGCIVTETTATREFPEPAECLTPVEPGTWGMIKSRYYR